MSSEALYISVYLVCFIDLRNIRNGISLNITTIKMRIAPIIVFSSKQRRKKNQFQTTQMMCVFTVNSNNFFILLLFFRRLCIHSHSHHPFIHSNSQHIRSDYSTGLCHSITSFHLRRPYRQKDRVLFAFMFIAFFLTRDFVSPVNHFNINIQ